MWFSLMFWEECNFKKCYSFFNIWFCKPLPYWVIIYSGNDTIKFTVRNSGRCWPLNFFSPRWIILLYLYQQGMKRVFFCKYLLATFHPKKAIIETVSRFNSKHVSKFYQSIPCGFYNPDIIHDRESVHTFRQLWIEPLSNEEYKTN